LLAFCWYVGERTFAATFAIPNKGIEQMARKNDGACGNPKLIRIGVRLPRRPTEIRQGRLERQDF
jgi:hypothetical protein